MDNLAFFQVSIQTKNFFFRSSNCDDGELQDIHSDISIEDDVIDLNNKVNN